MVTSKPALKADSQAKLRETRRRYDGMIAALRRSEAKMDPVLVALNDNVMYLKHNLNALAIASLKSELSTVNKDVTTLIEAMQTAINESSAFIDQMKNNR